MWYIDYSEIILFAAIFLTLLAVVALGFRRKKKILVGYCLLGVAIAVALGCNGFFVIRYDPEEAGAPWNYPKKELLEDFDALQNAICGQNPLAFADRTVLVEEFDKARSNITNSMSQEEFYQLVNPLVVAAKCGHTNLSVSEALIEYRKEKAKYLPLKVLVENDKLSIAETDTQYGVTQGDPILFVNEFSADRIIGVLQKNISHDGDNLAVVNRIASEFFPNKYYEFLEKPENFTLTLLNSRGEEYKLDIQGEYQTQYNTGAWQLHMERYAGVEPYKYEITGDTAVLTMRVFLEGKQKFQDFLTEFFAKLQEQQVKHLAIDLRGNFGGSPQLSRELLSYLIAQETPYFTGNTKLPWLYRLQGMGKDIVPKDQAFQGNITLMVDGGVFSTAGHFAAVFEKNKLGQIEGEPTGGGYACTDGSTNLVLKNTGLRLHNSRTYYEVDGKQQSKNTVAPK